MTTIRAIPTRYAGCHFRSRLEARWAIFFDSLDIRWIYEMEGFELGDGRGYLPDFYLPRLDAFVEIKPTDPTAYERELAEALALGTGKRVFIFGGNIPWFAGQVTDALVDPVAMVFGCSEFEGVPRAVWVDHGYVWCRCPFCGELGIEFQGRWGRLRCPCPKADRDQDGGAAAIVMEAYGRARSIRFDAGPELDRVDVLPDLSRYQLPPLRCHGDATVLVEGLAPADERRFRRLLEDEDA